MRSEKQIANLKVFKKGEYSDVQRKGTEINSQKAKTIKAISDWAVENLFKEVDKKTKTELYQELFNSLEAEARKGNLKAIQMLFDYSGLKPSDKVENLNPQILVTNNLSKEDKLEITNLIKEGIK